MRAHEPLARSPKLTPELLQIVLQTTAVATGTLPLAAGLVGVIPALAQLTEELDGSPPIFLSPLALCAWCFAVAFFGVYLAVPLRKQVIVKEKLTFPSGTATAQIISVLHNVPPPGSKPVGGYRPLATSEGEEERVEPAATKIDRAGWSALMNSFAVSAGFTVSFSAALRMISADPFEPQLLSLAFPVVYAIPIFNVFGNMAHNWLWW